MYVCLCAGISDRKIRELIASGHTNLRSLQKQCSAGANCGACVCHLQQMLRDLEQTDCEPSADMHRDSIVE